MSATLGGVCVRNCICLCIAYPQLYMPCTKRTMVYWRHYKYLCDCVAHSHISVLVSHSHTGDDDHGRLLFIAIILKRRIIPKNPHNAHTGLNIMGEISVARDSLQRHRRITWCIYFHNVTHPRGDTSPTQHPFRSTQRHAQPG